MVVGYSLGNKDNDEDIQVLGEVDDKVITYSQTLFLSLTRQCRNSCGYCSYRGRDGLIVPYSTIKICKDARSAGVREVVVVTGERPDSHPQIRANLDLWGFGSYLEYLYTVAELGFLEGLIPVLEVGMLSPSELKKLSEVCGVNRVILDSVDSKRFEKIYPNSSGKRLDIRMRSVEWCGKLGMPVISGIMVGIGESKTHRKNCLKALAVLHERYGHILEIVIQDFIPQPGTDFAGMSPPDHATMIETVELARDIFPDSVRITVPYFNRAKFKDFIKAGVRDIGHIPVGNYPVMSGLEPVDMVAMEEMIEKMGYRLQQRFPLGYNDIKSGKYSTKLGQVFDAYRYRIKKSEADKLKEVVK